MYDRNVRTLRGTQNRREDERKTEQVIMNGWLYSPFLFSIRLPVSVCVCVCCAWRVALHRNSTYQMFNFWRERTDEKMRMFFHSVVHFHIEKLDRCSGDDTCVSFIFRLLLTSVRCQAPQLNVFVLFRRIEVILCWANVIHSDSAVTSRSVFSDGNTVGWSLNQIFAFVFNWFVILWLLKWRAIRCEI